MILTLCFPSSKSQFVIYITSHLHVLFTSITVTRACYSCIVSAVTFIVLTVVQCNGL